MTENPNYIAKHLGNGKFECLLPDGETRNAGDNLLGMIRFTYFEDYSMPPIGWEISREQLMKDYSEKLMPKILNGDLKGL